MGSDSEAERRSIGEFQQRIEEIYGERDRSRGLEGSFMWFTEEVGELARCFINSSADRQKESEEFADCLAWLTTLASIRGVDLAQAAWNKYECGCPRCGGTPCTCKHRGEG